MLKSSVMKSLHECYTGNTKTEPTHKQYVQQESGFGNPNTSLFYPTMRSLKLVSPHTNGKIARKGHAAQHTIRRAHLCKSLGKQHNPNLCNVHTRGCSYIPLFDCSSTGSAEYLTAIMLPSHIQYWRLKGHFSHSIRGS